MGKRRREEGDTERERERGSRECSAVCLAQALSLVPGAD